MIIQLVGAWYLFKKKARKNPKVMQVVILYLAEMLHSYMVSYQHTLVVVP